MQPESFEKVFMLCVETKRVLEKPTRKAKNDRKCSAQLRKLVTQRLTIQGLIYQTYAIALREY